MTEEKYKELLKSKEKQFDLMLQQQEQQQITYLRELAAKDKELAKLKDKIADLNLLANRQ